ncbi:MAG: hypothetical protein IPJ94_24775 [Chloroflexi bacterium]|nr:hypothetical protein [Chloroflexota bacterium]
MNKPDPQKAIYLQPNQRRVPGNDAANGRFRPFNPSGSRTQATRRWMPGAPPLRDMRRAGKWPGSESESESESALP